MTIAMLAWSRIPTESLGRHSAGRNITRLRDDLAMALKASPFAFRRRLRQSGGIEANLKNMVSL